MRLFQDYFSLFRCTRHYDIKLYIKSIQNNIFENLEKKTDSWKLDYNLGYIELWFFFVHDYKNIHLLLTSGPAGFNDYNF